MGAQAATTVLSRIAGEHPATINQAFLGSCISLGRRTGILQVARRDDTPLNVFIAGRVGAAIKVAVCESTLWAIRRKATKPGSAY
jgi:NADH:ubiquinone reductase (H+-translocating)